jgi:outer membrane biosynthesis protein TonB
MGSREGETWGSWWRETAVYQWCAWAYDYAAAAWFWAALPFQLLAQVCITHALRALGPQAGAKWLVRGARLGVGSWLGWRGLVVLYQCYIVYVGWMELRWYWIPPMLSYVAFVNGWPVLVMYNIRLMTSEEKNWDEDSVDSRAAAGFAPEALLEHGLAPILQRYLAGYSWGRSGLQEAMRTAHHLVIPKTVDYDYTAASLALADAGVVEALRHIHDTATIWVRQQHARLTLNAIESALNSALGRRLRRDQQAAAERGADAPRAAAASWRARSSEAGTGRGADAMRAAADDLARQEAAAARAAASLLAEEENNAKKKKPKAPAPKKKKGKKGPPGRARGKAAPAPAPAPAPSPPPRAEPTPAPAPTPSPPPRAEPTPAPAPAPRAEPLRKAKAEIPAVTVKPPAPAPAPAPRAPPGLRAPAATEAEAAMRAFVRELGLSEDHAPWLLTETCQSPEQLKHVSIEAMVRLGLPPRAAATIRAAVGAPPPEEYFCSISCELMVDPCFAADGHSYERANITAWLASHDTSPLTNEALPHKMVVPNHALKALIWGFRDP